MSQERERVVPSGTRFVVRPGNARRGESACWRVRELVEVPAIQVVRHKDGNLSWYQLVDARRGTT